MPPTDADAPAPGRPPLMPAGPPPHPHSPAPAAGILEPADGDLRPGDPGTGRPVMRAQTVRELTPADEERLRAFRQEEAKAEAERLEEMLVSRPTLPLVPGFLTGPVAGALLLAALAVLGLFVFSQVTSTISALSALPPVPQYIGWATLGILTAAVGYAVLRLLVLYVRLQTNRQIRLHDLRELARRTHLRWLAHEKRAEAHAQLEDYLRTYPLERTRDQAMLLALGCDVERQERLREARDRLLDADRFATTDQWFAQFRDDFQAQLDEVAKLRITYFARRVALMTAVSPNSLVDVLVTGYGSFGLLADLCRVYNLRVGRLGTTVLLARIFFNAYLAGQINEFEGLTEDQLHSLLGDWATSKVLAKVGTKTLAGTLNFLLLKRLGRYAVRLLRPVTAE